MPLKLQTKQTITKKLTSLYAKAEHLKAYLQKESFDINFSFKRLSQKDIERNFNQINLWIKELKQFPFEIKFASVSYRSLGEQSLPCSLVVSQEQFLAYLGKKREFFKHISLIEESFSQFALLKPLLIKEPKLIMEYGDVWDRLLKVCHYFMAYPKPPNLYIRELEIEEVDSKFIELHKRVLDKLLETILEPSFYNAEITKISNYGFEKKYGLKYDLPTKYLPKIKFRKTS